MTFDLATLANLPGVAKAGAWNDRVYLNMVSADSKHRYARETKIWVKADVMTIQTGRGYPVEALDNEIAEAAAAFAALGGTVRRVDFSGR